MPCHAAPIPRRFRQHTQGQGFVRKWEWWELAAKHSQQGMCSLERRQCAECGNDAKLTWTPTNYYTKSQTGVQELGKCATLVEKEQVTFAGCLACELRPRIR